MDAAAPLKWTINFILTKKIEGLKLSSKFELQNTQQKNVKLKILELKTIVVAWLGSGSTGD